MLLNVRFLYQTAHTARPDINLIINIIVFNSITRYNKFSAIWKIKSGIISKR